MHLRQFSGTRFDLNTFLLCRLSLVWIAGLSLGYAAARFYGDALVSCVRLCVTSSPSVFGALSVNFFPLLISACAVFFYRFLLYPVCFLRSLILGIGFGAVCRCFGGAGLMMVWLLMFSAVVYAPVMLWYWFRRITLGKESFFPDTAACGAVSLAVGILDIWIVSPTLAEIMNF